MKIILDITERERILMIAIFRNAKALTKSPQELRRMNNILTQLGDES